MSGDFLLDWTSTSLSLFNIFLLLWLGLTVLANAERRTWGIWLAGVGLLAAGAFFVAHSAILNLGLLDADEASNAWWHLGWAPILASPLSWYVVMLWYTGFWDDPQRRLRRQQFGLALALGMTAFIVVLLVIANPFPSFLNIITLSPVATPTLGGMPVLILAYLLYNLLCIGLALDALLRPASSRRVMGDLAQERARPWLVAASGALLLVGLLVGWVVVWIVATTQQERIDRHLVTTIEWFDLAISALIGLAILLIGRAVVSYEIFTGKVLPRRGLLRQWQNAVILALGYSVLVAATLTAGLRPVYALLLTTILVAVLFTLLNRQTYVERERAMSGLRPFIASQGLYDSLHTSGPSEVDVQTPFRALCETILGARSAYLVPLGALAPLAGPPLCFPTQAPVPAWNLGELTERLHAAAALCMPLSADRFGGAIWAIPLSGQRGLVGAFLLGPKADGSLYTQEEIEIARSSGERLVDTQASAEMARRLMALQRQRLAETQIVDRRTRRVLHDQVLPKLHAALLLQGGQGAEALSEAHRDISDLLREIPPAGMLSVARLGLMGALERAVSDEFSGAFDQVIWDVDARGREMADMLSPVAAEVILYAAYEAIRNAARHGRRGEPTRPLHLTITVCENDGLDLIIYDDGVGMDAAAGSATGGSGQGLALHGTLMAVIGGSLEVTFASGKYTRVLVKLPRASMPTAQP